MKKRKMACILTMALIFAGGCDSQQNTQVITLASSESSAGAVADSSQQSETTDDVSPAVMDSELISSESVIPESVPLESVSSEPVSPQVEESLSESTWRELYVQKTRDFLEDFNSWYGESSGQLKFDLLDINQDGTPELLISYGSDRVSGCDLFTVADGQVKKTGDCCDLWDITI